LSIMNLCIMYVWCCRVCEHDELSSLFMYDVAVYYRYHEPLHYLCSIFKYYMLMVVWWFIYPEHWHLVISLYSLTFDSFIIIFCLFCVWFFNLIYSSLFFVCLLLRLLLLLLPAFSFAFYVLFFTPWISL